MKLIERRIGLLFAVFLGLLVIGAARSAWLGVVKAGTLKQAAATQQESDLLVPVPVAAGGSGSGVAVGTGAGVTVGAGATVAAGVGAATGVVLPVSGTVWVTVVGARPAGALPPLAITCLASSLGDCIRWTASAGSRPGRAVR